MDYKNTQWLLLIASLPTSGATPRMRLWRAIKSLGCVSLRDGAYLLPGNDAHAFALGELAEQINADGGQGWVVDLVPRSVDDAMAFHTLFSRTNEYVAFDNRVSIARKMLGEQPPSEVVRTLKRLRKEFDSLQRIDFFPDDASLFAQSSWADFEEGVNMVLSPGEPHADGRPVPRLDLDDFQGRTWATRRHLWVDRVASAWLIRRFIDHDARFLWLDSPASCPVDAVGFDFDDAAFTHSGNKVTFEGLMASFALAQDAGLVKLATLVHALDVGGAPNPEASGFEAILSGARARLDGDDALLQEISGVLDSLYAYYSKAAPP